MEGGIITWMAGVDWSRFWTLLVSSVAAAWKLLPKVSGIAGGVVIAWLLQQYSQRRKIKRLRRALVAECRSLLVGQIPQFIDLFSRISANLARRVFLPGLAVRAMSTVYRTAIKELAAHL